MKEDQHHRDMCLAHSEELAKRFNGVPLGSIDDDDVRDAIEMQHEMDRDELKWRLSDAGKKEAAEVAIRQEQYTASMSGYGDESGRMNFDDMVARTADVSTCMLWGKMYAAERGEFNDVDNGLFAEVIKSELKKRARQYVTTAELATLAATVGIMRAVELVLEAAE